MLILIGVGKSMANQADLFSYDAVTIENQMAQLDQLEGYVLDNPGVTLGQMATDGNTLASLVSDPNGIKGFNLINERVLGIPGFWWGFVPGLLGFCFTPCVLFGGIGVLVVMLVGKDPHETKLAILGCAIPTAAIGILIALNVVSMTSGY